MDGSTQTAVIAICGPVLKSCTFFERATNTVVAAMAVKETFRPLKTRFVLRNHRTSWR